MVVKVYGSIRAACPQRVLACLIEKGIEFEIVHVDLDKGEQKHPEFLLLQVLYILDICTCDNFLYKKPSCNYMFFCSPLVKFQ